MNRSERLLKAFAQSVALGCGLHTRPEMTLMLEEKYSPAFPKFISSCVKRGILRRAAKGIYESTITPPDPSTAIYKIVQKLRHRHFNYISLESQLSHIGDISQVMFDHLTVITAGRSGVFQTLYGTIEFTHTKKDINKLKESLYYDSEIKMWRATPEQAIADLKACRRNLHMLKN